MKKIYQKILQKLRPEIIKQDVLDLIYNSKFSFYKYNNIKEFETLSFKSKYSFLVKLLVM